VLPPSSAKKPDPTLLAAVNRFFASANAFTWVDKLLPIFLPRSIIPAPPRPSNTARFAHLFILKSYILTWLDPTEHPTFEHPFSEFLTTSRSQSVDSLQTLQRMLDLAEVYSWLSSRRSEATPLLTSALAIASSKSQDPSYTTIHTTLSHLLTDAVEVNECVDCMYKSREKKREEGRAECEV
jgi:hypothetical protein